MQVGGTDGGESQLSSWPSSAGSVESAFLAVMEHFKKEGLSGPQQVRSYIFHPRGTQQTRLMAAVTFMHNSCCNRSLCAISLGERETGRPLGVCRFEIVQRT